MFKKLKSFSCPHLVLTSCQTMPGPGLSTANMKTCRSFTDIKARQFHMTLPIVSCSEDQWTDSRTDNTTSEATPCIEITPPTWEPRTSFDSGYTEERPPSAPFPWGTDRRRSTETYKLTPCNIDVHLWYVKWVVIAFCISYISKWEVMAIVWCITMRGWLIGISSFGWKGN